MKFLCLSEVIVLLVTITGAFSAFTGEQEDGLAKHNEFRQIHQVPVMTLDQQLCDEAQARAEEIAQVGRIETTDRGENLYMGCSVSEYLPTVEEAVTNWYSEVCEPGYDFNNPGYSGNTGHFTQVIWKESTKLGIGRVEKVVDDYGLCAFIVGRYKETGNLVGAFTENVPRGNFDESNCRSISSKRRKYLDAKGNPVIVVTPFVEVGVPKAIDGHQSNGHSHAHGHSTKRLNGKEKN